MTKNPFDDFPLRGTWFPWERASGWRKKHEKEILEAIKDQALLEEFPHPPDVIFDGPGNTMTPEAIDWLVVDLRAWLRKVEESIKEEKKK